MYGSVLNSVKKMLGIDESYDVFDPELIIHINSALDIANQLGANLKGNGQIDGPTTMWTDIVDEDIVSPIIKTYVYLRTRIVFDPPNVGVLHEAMERQIQELEWRLSVQEDRNNDNESGVTA